ncbi:hypothetical protein APHAL10511_000257 [Amanita phalloides]|nr:hypothetical protein APHAL10511_000257 [Amanita phalloides]
MPFLEGATNVHIGNSTFRDIAGDVYSFRREGQTPIDQLEELSVPEAVYDMDTSRYCPGTGEWLLKGMQDWMREDGVPILLLSGPAGTGKSTVARTFVHACVTRARYPVISFCFEHDDPRRSDLNRVLPTLARQLHRTDLPGLKEAIDDALEADPFIWSRALGKQFTEFVIRPVSESFAKGNHHGRTYVVLLDGIDACRDHAVLRQFFSDIKSVIADEAFYNRIKIICTARDVPSVTAAFRPLLNYYRHVSTKSYDARGDVMKYLVETVKRENPNPSWNWEVILNYIANKAEGNFGIAARAFQGLRASNVHSSDDIQRVVDRASTSQDTHSLNGVPPHPRRRDTRSLADPSPLTGVSPLTILLQILRKRGNSEPVKAVVNSGTVDFMADLLSMNDFVKIPSQLSDVQDALNLIEFIIYLLDNELLHATTLRDGNRRARRLLIKLGKHAKSVLPRSLFLNSNDIQMNFDHTIGYGGFSNVFEGQFRGNRVALKRINQNTINEVFVREALTWRTLSNDFVLPFMGVYESPQGLLCLVSPFMEHGTLRDWRDKKSPSVAEVELRILQVAEGIQYLHYEGVIHCDLRGHNVLLDSNLQVRIADFGLTRDSGATATTNNAMSHAFAAPELFSGDGKDELDTRLKRTEKTDIYAFACLYYEVHFNRFPWSSNYIYAIKRVTEGGRPERQPNPPLREEAWELIQKCWHQDPGKRPTINDVVDTMILWSPEYS